MRHMGEQMQPKIQSPRDRERFSAVGVKSKGGGGGDTGTKAVVLKSPSFNESIVRTLLNYKEKAGPELSATALSLCERGGRTLLVSEFIA